MTTIHIRNLEIVTLDDAGTILHDADLVVQDGRIAYVGEAPPDLRADEVAVGGLCGPLQNTSGHVPSGIRYHGHTTE